MQHTDMESQLQSLLVAWATKMEQLKVSVLEAWQDSGGRWTEAQEGRSRVRSEQEQKTNLITWATESSVRNRPGR